MLLAVDIDNVQISFGLFEDVDEDSVNKRFKIATVANKTSDEYAVTIDAILSRYCTDVSDVDGVVISSVVPSLTEILKDAVLKVTGDANVLVVGKGIKTGFAIKIDNPSELGTDLVANAAAVMYAKRKENKAKTPAVIIDMGTATTVFAINGNGEYIGGSILPGIGISFDVLHGRAAQLPIVTPAAPINIIGRNSSDSVRSGIILGSAIMIDGFIDRFADEMKTSKTDVYITGEYAEQVIPYCKHGMIHVESLTLLGLAYIYRNNFKLK